MTEKKVAPNPLQGGGQCGVEGVDEHCKDSQNAATTQPENADIDEDFDNAMNKPQEDEYADCFVDASIQYEVPKYLLKKDGIPFLPLEALSAINAKSKNGKTQFAQILAASVLGCTSFGIERALSDNRGVLYIDTEQRKFSSSKIYSRLNKLCGDTNGRLYVYNVKLKEIDERLAVIQYEIERLSPAFVILDHMIDLAHDFNNSEESATTLQSLLNIATIHKCNICCVIHQNKKADDENMKGHLGTKLLEKSENIFKTKGDKKGNFVAEETDSREELIGKIAWSIVNDVFVPKSAEALADARRAELNDFFAPLFNGKDEMKCKDIKATYCKINPKGESTVKNNLKEATNLGVLQKDKRGIYRFVGLG